MNTKDKEGACQRQKISKKRGEKKFHRMWKMIGKQINLSFLCQSRIFTVLSTIIIQRPLPNEYLEWTLFRSNCRTTV